MDKKTEHIDLYKDIVAGTKDVFSTMLMLDLLAGDAVQNDEVDTNFSSILGLGGDIKGMLAVHCPEETATKITGELLGIEIDDIDEDVNDAIGEIANMIAGNLKISFENSGINTLLAIPTAVAGNSYKTSRPQQAYCVIVPFSFEDKQFWIELQYVVVNR